MSGIEFGKTKEGNTVTKYLLKNKKWYGSCCDGSWGNDRIRARAG